MKYWLLLAAVVILVAGVALQSRKEQATTSSSLPPPPLKSKSVKQLIDSLREIQGEFTDAYYMTEGRGFLPANEQSDFLDDNGKDLQPVPDALKALIARGVDSLPELMDHLVDHRLTQLHTGGYFSDRYDPRYSDPARQPQGLNQVDMNSHRSPNEHPYTVTVGDLCYVAIGQIVNRGLESIPHAHIGPLGGAILPPAINSPTQNHKLAEAVRKDWGGLTKDEHFHSLMDDLTTGDIGRHPMAAERLLYYYPERSTGFLVHLLQRKLYPYAYEMRLSETVERILQMVNESDRKAAIMKFQHDDRMLASCLPAEFARRIESAETDEIFRAGTHQKELTAEDRNGIMQSNRAKEVFADAYPNIDFRHPPPGEGVIPEVQSYLVSALATVANDRIRDVVLKRLLELDPEKGDVDFRLGKDQFACSAARMLAGFGHDDECLKYFDARIKFQEEHGVDDGRQDFLSWLKRWRAVFSHKGTLPDHSPQD